MMDATPDMAGDPNATGMDPNMGGDPNMMGDPNAAGEENYGADFDAGVQASEEDDPKKFNQQLTGKLSQSLQKYEDSLGGQPDDLPKYVGGMILAQLVKYMQPDEFDDMVNNAKEGMQPAEGNEEAPADDDVTNAQGEQVPPPTEEPAPQQPMNEDVKKKINELFQNLCKDNREEDKKDEEKTDIAPDKTGKIGDRRKGFLPKNLKK